MNYYTHRVSNGLSMLPLMWRFCESTACIGVFLFANIAGELKGFYSTEAETSIYIQRYMVSLSLPHPCVLVIVGSHTD